jgi:nitrogen fixation protein FixH
MSTSRAMSRPASKSGAPVAGPRAPARRRWDAMLLLIGGIFLLFLLVNGVMLWVTLRYPAELVSASYYEDAKRYGEVMAAERASNATGWRVEMRQEPAASGRDRIGLAVVDPQGRPVTGLSGAVHAYRPSNEALDQDLPLTERPDAPGRYAADFRKPQPGHWELTFELSRGSSRLLQKQDWVAP